MQTIQALDAGKQKVLATIEENRAQLLACAQSVLENPELGFKEVKTSALVKRELEALGIPCQDGLAITGVKGRLRGRGKGPTVCIIGELDAIRCFGHPYADPVTGAAHACGHNGQISSMLTAAYGLAKSGIMEQLDGDVVFFAVPAEEFGELDYRTSLKESGKITYMSGKQELIHTGAFADVDLAMMVHSQAECPETRVYLEGSSLGFVAKQITFTGKAAHASKPSEGINALNAAMLALMGIHANRETFLEKDRVRIHSILTNGGDLVNVVPSNVTMETCVRATNMAAMEDAARKTDLAIQGACTAVGAQCEIRDTPGYEPLRQNLALSHIFEENALCFVGPENMVHGEDMTGSTDMGDLSGIMPCIHPSMGGFTGAAHGADFAAANPEAAYLLPGVLMAFTAVDLLSNGAEKALDIVKKYKENKGEEK